MSFVNCCELGKIDKTMSLFTFSNACENGYLNVARWLLYIKSDINISDEEDYAFRYACQNGHLNVAQWLFSVKPDINISAENEHAFCWACENDRLDMVEWLKTLNPEKYYIIMKNNTIINWDVKVKC